MDERGCDIAREGGEQLTDGLSNDISNGFVIGALLGLTGLTKVQWHQISKVGFEAAWLVHYNLLDRVEVHILLLSLRLVDQGEDLRDEELGVSN